MLTSLIDKGLLSLDPGVLTEPVVVTRTTADQEMQMRVSKPGVPVPPLNELSVSIVSTPKFGRGRIKTIAALRSDVEP